MTPRGARHLTLAGLLGLSGCTLNLARIHDPPRAVAVTTPEQTRSMIYVARTDSGVVAVDLGYLGAGRALRRALRGVGARPEAVAAVFLTHSHRDHIRGWRAVRGARFVMAAREVPLFAGGASHADFPSRAAAALFPGAYPGGGDSLRVLGFSRDTTFVLGSDTLRAFLLPGHTAGSAAYLFRGVLFVGDALAYSTLGGFRLAKHQFTADAAANRRSVASLWARVAPHGVEWVCTAHAKCARYEALRRKLGSSRPVH